MTSLALLTNVPFHMASPSLMNYVFGALGLVMFGPGSLVLLGSIFLDLPRLTLTEEGFVFLTYAVLRSIPGRA